MQLKPFGFTLRPRPVTVARPGGDGCGAHLRRAPTILEPTEPIHECVPWNENPATNANAGNLTTPKSRIPRRPRDDIITTSHGMSLVGSKHRRFRFVRLVNCSLAILV